MMTIMKSIEKIDTLNDSFRHHHQHHHFDNELFLVKITNEKKVLYSKIPIVSIVPYRFFLNQKKKKKIAIILCVIIITIIMHI